MGRILGDTPLRSLLSAFKELREKVRGSPDRSAPVWLALVDQDENTIFEGLVRNPELLLAFQVFNEGNRQWEQRNISPLGAEKVIVSTREE